MFYSESSDRPPSLEPVRRENIEKQGGFRNSALRFGHTTDERRNHANLLNSTEIHRCDVVCCDHCVVHKHPCCVAFACFLGDFGLAHLNDAVSAGVSDLNGEQPVLATDKPWHQFELCRCIELHMLEFGG